MAKLHKLPQDVRVHVAAARAESSLECGAGRANTTEAHHREVVGVLKAHEELAVISGAPKRGNDFCWYTICREDKNIEHCLMFCAQEQCLICTVLYVKLHMYVKLYVKFNMSSYKISVLELEKYNDNDVRYRILTNDNEVIING